MKKIILVVVCISLFLLSSCEKKEEFSNLQGRGGVFYKINEDKPYSGKVYEEYNNGQTRMEGTYTDGLPDGEFVDYYEDGQVKMKIEYDNGLFDGKYIHYFENGEIFVEGKFKNGKVIEGSDLSLLKSLEKRN